jgi:hypothetical protein
VSWLRSHYGAGPLHLVGLLACFAVAAYAVTRVFGQSGWRGILLWFVICVVAHDFIGWPVYTVADRVALRVEQRHPGRPPLVPWINHVRVPTVISGVLLVMFFPLIFRLSNASYEGYTGFSENVYILNWLVVTGVLFAGSAIAYLVRRAIIGRRGAGRSVVPAGPGPGRPRGDPDAPAG